MVCRVEEMGKVVFEAGAMGRVILRVEGMAMLLRGLTERWRLAQTRVVARVSDARQQDIPSW